jgi:hypothetical protein
VLAVACLRFVFFRYVWAKIRRNLFQLKWENPKLGKLGILNVCFDRRDGERSDSLKLNIIVTKPITAQ